MYVCMAVLKLPFSHYFKNPHSCGPFIYHIFQITLLSLSIFDLQNVTDTKTVVTFKEYVLLTSCVQSLHKQHIYHYF